MAYWTRRNTIKNSIGLLLAPLFLYLFFRWLERSLLYQPSAQLDDDASKPGHPREEVWLTTSDGVRLHAWFFAAPKDSPRAALAWLVCHGNGGNVSHRLALYDVLLATGANVLAFDYRGYGRSEGRPNEEGTYRDALAASVWLRQRGFAAGRILAYGESLGCAIATELARRENIGGLVLQSGFTSAPDLGQEMLPWLPVHWLARNRYETIQKLPELRVPLLVMHGRADSIIPFAHSEKLFAVAREPKLFWELAGDHNDQPNADRAKFSAGLEKFLIELVKAPPLTQSKVL